MKNMKKILVLLFTVITMLAFAGSVNGDLTFEQSRISITPLDGYDLVEYDADAAYYAATPGAPYLPVYTVRVLVPAGASHCKVTLTAEEMIQIADGVNCYPAQAEKPVSAPDGEFTPQDEMIYVTDELYPGETTVTLVSDSQIRGYHIVNLKVNMVKLNPVTQALYLVKNLSYQVTYDIDRTTARYQRNDIFTGIVADSVVNPDAVAAYAADFAPASRATVDLLVIADTALKSAFEAYAQNRAAREGLSYEVISMAEVDNLYTGTTQQLRIKECAKDYVTNNNTTYIILGGDSPAVPDQDTYGAVGSSTDTTLPCDTFYVCFDKQFNWNADGDDKVGEGSDNADIDPDAIIGRISVRNASELDGYLAKVNNYLNTTDQNFLNKALLTGVKLWVTGDAKKKSDAMFDNYIKPNWPEVIKGTMFDNDPGVTMTATSYANKLNEGFNLLHMATHGNYTVWSMESGSGFRTANADMLTNKPAGTVITMACLSNGFDKEYCLGEAFMRNPNGGALAFIGAGRYGWGNPSGTSAHGTSLQYNDRIIRDMLSSDDHNIGAAFIKGKQEMASQAGSGATRWVHFCLNIIGDPTINFMKEPGQVQPTPTPTVTPTPTAIPTATPYCYILSQYKPVVSSGDFSPDFPKTALVDGDDTTVWGSKYNEGPQWFFVDLGKIEQVDHIIVKFFNPYYSPYFHIGVSNDAKQWDFAATVPNSMGGEEKVEVNKRARYVGMYLTQGPKKVYGIKEFEVHQLRMPTTPTPTATIMPTATPTATMTPTPTKPPVDDWQSGIDYKVGNRVYYGGKVWVCELDHTSNASWYPGAAGVWFWKEVTE